MGVALTSEKPKHHGENQVYKQLIGQNDNSLYFWSSIEFIPGVNDIDLLIWHEKVGVFVIEIKAIQLEMLKSFGYHSCEIIGRGIHRSPQNQAYDAMLSLRNYLSPKISKLPFMVATVCWPLISRSQWKINFRHSREIAELSNSMIMSDDLFATSEILEKKLLDIWKTPPIRKGSDYVFKNDREIFTNFLEYLNINAKPQPLKSEKEKLIALEKGIRKELMRAFSPYQSNKAVFKGRPGTGKTFRILQIAIMHAQEGSKVLICCFNQVLSSEFKRILNLIDLSQKELGYESNLKENIDALDITTFAKRICDDLKISISEDDYDEWGPLITEEIKNSNLIEMYPRYDTLLIDESQDFTQWQIELPLLFSNKDSSVILGFGTGQEIYDNNKSQKNTSMFERYKVYNLRRNFRNAKPIYELACLALEAEFNTSKIESIYEKIFITKKNNEDTLDFDIDDKAVPKLIYLKEDLDPGEYGYKEKTIVELANSYENFIFEEFKALKNQFDASDLLVLVPDTLGEEVTAARIALDNIFKKCEVGYIDYVDSKNRRKIAPQNHIRLVTFHSCRGLESARVIILGVEKLDYMSRKLNINAAKLAYIILSRAIFNVSIIIRIQRKNNIIDFLEKTTSHIHLYYQKN